MTITDFLLARIAEDEALAERLEDNPERPRGEYLVSGVGRVAVVGGSYLLAECEAKRRVVEIASAGVAAVSEGRPHRSFLSGRVHDSVNILSALALPYADHADWRESWRP